jgi:hypothetical protein
LAGAGDRQADRQSAFEEMGKALLVVMKHVVEESDGDLMGDGVNMRRDWKASLNPELYVFRRMPSGR